MAIAPSRLGEFVLPLLDEDDLLLRKLRSAGLVEAGAPDDAISATFRRAREEHNAMSEDDREYNSPHERIRVFLEPYLTSKGRRWAVPLDSLDLPDN